MDVSKYLNIYGAQEQGEFLPIPHSCVVWHGQRVRVRELVACWDGASDHSDGAGAAPVVAVVGQGVSAGVRGGQSGAVARCDPE